MVNAFSLFIHSPYPALNLCTAKHTWPAQINGLFNDLHITALVRGVPGLAFFSQLKFGIAHTTFITDKISLMPFYDFRNHLLFRHTNNYGRHLIKPFYFKHVFT